MKTYKISEEVIHAILDYLSIQPFKQVFKLIQVLQQSEVIKEEAKSGEKNENKKV